MTRSTTILSLPVIFYLFKGSPILPLPAPPPDATSALHTLRSTIQKRWSETVDPFNWPCSAGCSRCCQRLKKMLQITGIEWEHIYRDFRKLPLSEQDRITEQLKNRAGDSEGLFSCPFTNTMGWCMIYENRPLECRTYGAYRGREFDVWCDTITEFVKTIDNERIIWGNHDALLHEITTLLGAQFSLFELFDGIESENQ